MAEEQKKRRMTPRKAIMAILFVIMVVSGIGVIREQMEVRRQLEEQERLAQLAQQTTEAVETTEAETMPEETEPPYVSPIDFEALWAENEDVVGWITVPDTRIDYPILHTDNNDTYLHTDFNGNESVYGAIYLDCDSEPDFSGWNNPIYGHHMRNGTMFKDVVKFKDPEFFQEHRYFDIFTPERTIRLKTIACYYTSADGIVRQTQFENQDAFDEWLQKRVEPCKFADVPEGTIDSVFILVTCSYEMNNARTLLLAVEVDEEGNLISAKK